MKLNVLYEGNKISSKDITIQCDFLKFNSIGVFLSKDFTNDITRQSSEQEIKGFEYTITTNYFKKIKNMMLFLTGANIVRLSHTMKTVCVPGLATQTYAIKKNITEIYRAVLFKDYLTLKNTPVIFVYYLVMSVWSGLSLLSGTELLVNYY